MIDEIKNLPNESGIYKITSPTGKIYVGEANNLQVRCKYYLTPNRIKKQRAIYNSLIKHSVSSHTFEVLELCSVDILLERERYWQEHFDSVSSGLNCFLTPTKDKKKVLSEKTKQIMSEKSKGENNSFYGKKHTNESLKKISNSSKGINNPNYGGKFKTDEWLLKQSLSNSKVNLKITDTITDDVLIFMNSKEAAKHFNCSPSTIRENKKNNWLLKRRFKIEDIK